MAAAQKRLEVSARNVANGSVAPSDDEVAAAFAALRMDQVEISGGGTAAVVRQTPEQPVDLAAEATEQLVARYTFAANAKVAKTARELQKALLDVKA